MHLQRRKQMDTPLCCLRFEKKRHNQAVWKQAVRLMVQRKSCNIFLLVSERRAQQKCWFLPGGRRLLYATENLSAANEGILLGNGPSYTYAKLVLLTDTELESIRPDIIIPDKSHRCGA